MTDLTPAEIERLAVMIEEARRLQGACNQALTHGLIPRAQQDLTIALLRVLAVKDAMLKGGDLVDALKSDHDRAKLAVDGRMQHQGGE